MAWTTTSMISLHFMYCIVHELLVVFIALFVVLNDKLFV